MARDPEDQHGASSAGGDDSAPENSPNTGEPAGTPEDSQQEELPLGDGVDGGEAPSETPEEAPAEEEPAHDDQVDDTTVHEDPGYDDPYAHNYHYDAEDQYHEYHDEYHHEQSEEDYESNYTPSGHDDFHETGSSEGGGYGGGYYDDEDEEDDEEEESEGFGGPIKPFLEHLEDLRWTVMKCVIALMVGMLVALMGAGYIIDFLAGPLKKAQRMEKVLAQGNPHKRTIPIQIGEGVVGTIHEADLQNLQKKGMLQDSATNLSEITSISLRPTAPDANGTLYQMEMFVDTTGSKDVKWSLELKAFGPMKGFMIALRIGFYGGFALSIPFIIYFVAQFVVPALRVREKRWLVRLSAAGSILFAIGVAFAYFIIMKIALWASVGFAEMLGLHADEWQAEEYISFVCMFLIGMGVAFQLPMVLLFLVKVGLLDYKKLADWRMYAVVANLIVSAILTPTGDPVTLLLVAAPLHLLYEISIVIAWFMHRSKIRKEAAEEAAYEEEFGPDEDVDDEDRNE